MRSFKVPDMSCGHCTATIEKAIKAIDPTASVTCGNDVDEGLCHPGMERC